MPSTVATGAPWPRCLDELISRVAPRLQPLRMELVDVTTLRLTLIAAAMLAYTCLAVHTRRPVTSSLSTFPVAAVSRDAAPDPDLDAYGNDVTHAVAEYSLDREGSLYERHAPQVELPHLGSPKS